MLELPTTGPLDWNSTLPSASLGDSQERVRDSAREFESLLIGQIMRTMREASGGWLNSADDQAGNSMAEFAEQQMARVLCAAGGFGLAALVEQGLTRSGQARTLSEALPTKSRSPG